MLRYAVLALGPLAILGACEAPPPAVAAATAPWAYAPLPLGWPAPATRGRFGRGEAPVVMASLPIVAAARASGAAAPPPLVTLQLATPWSVPGDGPARAVLYGATEQGSAIDVVDVDGGRVMLQHAQACHGPVVGVTAATAVCADANGVTGLALAGRRAWAKHVTYLAMTDDRVLAVDETDGIVVLDADDGDALGKLVLPPGIEADELHSTCGATGRELFAARRDNTLARIADAERGLAVTWAAPVGELVALDGCQGDTVLALVREGGQQAVLAFDRATGTSLGRIDDVRGWWPSRIGDGVEVATGSGIVRTPRNLATREVVSPLIVGELLAQRGAARLVRVSPVTAMILDATGVRAYVAFAWAGAVLGDTALVAADWTGSPAHTIGRLALPPRETRPLRLVAAGAPVIVPAELRDLPTATPPDPASVIAGGDAAAHGVTAIAASTAAPSLVFAATQAVAPSDAVAGGVAGIDLAARTVWHRADGCGPGIPVGLAAARTVVVCAAQRTGDATVRATGFDGTAQWEWIGSHIDRVQAAGDAIVVVAGQHADVLDAATGRARGRLASDDGRPSPAIAVELAALSGLRAETLIITMEAGRLVARAPGASLLPVWALAVDGAVIRLAPLPGGVLVALADGDAFHVDAATATATALAGIGLAWDAAGDVMLGTAAGGPIPGDPATVSAPVPPPSAAAAARSRGRRRERRPIAAAPVAPRPAMATPRPLPAPLGDAWHLALHDGRGALRARNEYPVFGPVVPGTVRGSGASPLVIVTGAQQREVLLIDPATGDPQRRVQLPEDATASGAGGVIVNGVAIGFVVVARPLRVVTF